jgi:hypothetical protein
MKIIKFADSSGRPAQVRADYIVAVIRSDSFITNGAHPDGGYHPAILLLQGGHQLETNTEYTAITKSWAGYVWGNQ